MFICNYKNTFYHNQKLLSCLNVTYIKVLFCQKIGIDLAYENLEKANGNDTSGLFE